MHINAYDSYGNSIKLLGCVDGSSECGTVPEPAPLALISLGLLFLGFARRYKSD